jgi:tetratricopeptide (TPR) repeat protein
MHGPKAENPYSESYIPHDVSTKIQELAIKANNLIFQRATRPESLGGLIIELRSALDSPSSWFVWRILGRIHWKLADHDGWESAFTKSIELKPDPFTCFLLASRLYASGEYAQAEKIYDQLERDEFFNPERGNADFAHDVCTGYFLTKLFQGKFAEVLELTDKCEYPDLQSRYYLFRSGTYKRVADYWRLMDDAKVNLELAIELDGYAKYVRKVLKNVIKSISISVKGGDFQELGVDAIVKGLLDFSARHILGAFSEGTETAADMRAVIRNFKSYAAASNIFVSDGKWDLLLEGGEGEERAFGGYSEEGGMIVAHLYNVANLNKGYAFGRDSAGHQYYLPVKEFQNGIDLFKGLANGQPVAIDCADVEAAEGKASRARLWMVVD